MNLSLHPIAEAVRSQGRNGDSMLVHMTPGEVAALQRMAEANGGTLTINPETGQPEAFFLAALLPALAGAAMPGIAAATGIAALANPLTSSLLIGGLTGALTGDMRQGLMAGLGAYGGFGLGESLMGAGAPAAAAQTAQTAAAQTAQAAQAAQNAAAQNAAAQAAKTAATPGVTQAISGPVSASAATPILPFGSENVAAAQQLGINAMPNVYGAAPAAAPQVASIQPVPSSAPIQPVPVMTPNIPSAPGFGPNPVAAAVQTPPSMMEAIRSGSGTVSGSDVLNQMSQGAKNIYDTKGGIGNFAKENFSNISMAAAPMMVEQESDIPRDNLQYYYPEFRRLPGGGVYYGKRAERRIAKGGSIPGYQYGGIPAMTPRGIESLDSSAGKPQATEGQRSMARMMPTALSLAGMNPLAATIAGVASTLAMERNNPALAGSVTNGILPALMGGYQNPAPVVGMNDMRVVTPGGPGQAPVVVTSDSSTGGFAPSNQGDTSSGGGYGTFNGGASMAAGGIAAMSYKRGGLKEDSFIIPADVLAALGNGSNNAGLMALNKMLAKVGAPSAEKIDGPGDGMSDSIPTSIEGKQPARVAKDEAYVPTEAVRRLGDGDVKKGAKKLYNLMARVRKAAHGNDKQQRRVNPDKVARA